MKQNKKLAGKVAFITGATRGIGHAIAELFAEQGADLALHCHVLDREEKVFLTKLKKKYGVRAFFYEAELPDISVIKDMVARVQKDFKKIDILVNNAGVYPETKFFTTTEKSWDYVMDVNLKSSFFITQLITKKMLKTGGGNVVNIASVAGVYPRTTGLEYAVSKAGMIHLSKSLAQVLAPKIRVNVVAPSYTWTGFMGFMKNKQDVKRRLQGIPLKAFNAPKDVAEAALFLASDASRYITGGVIIIDGGRGAARF